MFENPRRGRQARNFGKIVPKILDLKSSSEQIFSENCRWVPLTSSQCYKRGIDFYEIKATSMVFFIESQRNHIDLFWFSP